MNVFFSLWTVGELHLFRGYGRGLLLVGSRPWSSGFHGWTAMRQLEYGWDGGNVPKKAPLGDYFSIFEIRSDTFLLR